jgi:hypothetical protein
MNATIDKGIDFVDPVDEKSYHRPGLRVLMCGDRNWTDREVIEKVIEVYQPEIVIEGEARGADTISREVAEAKGIKVEKYPADWDKNGKGAGPIRNLQMLVQGKPDIVLAFHSKLSESKGTLNMIMQSIQRDIPVVLFELIDGVLKRSVWKPAKKDI